MADGRVLIGVDQIPLIASPTWTRFDNISDCRCAGWDISTGRQSEFDVTGTGTATVYFHDRAGAIVFDDLVGSPILLQALNPVTAVWEPQYRGIVDDIAFEPNPRAVVSNVQIKCKDMFDYLARSEMVLGFSGNTPPSGMHSVCFWEDGPVNTRLEDLLGDTIGAGLATGQYVVFSGNVDVIETLYDPGDSFLVAIRDACDAEFPGIANVYVDRFGRVCFHGRFARFDPDGVSASAGDAAWDFQRWDAATRSDVTTGRAQIREFSYNTPMSRIRNAAIAWPRETEDGEPFPESLKTAQVKIDNTSLIRYGYAAMPPMGDLIIKEHKTNGNTGAQECELFAEFYVNNYAVPRKNIETVTFKSVWPTGAAEHVVAAETWALMTEADISDIIHLFVDEAGLADEEFYIEGFRKELRVLNDDFDMLTVTPNLTPFAYYTDNVFEGA